LTKDGRRAPRCTRRSSVAVSSAGKNLARWFGLCTVGFLIMDEKNVKVIPVVREELQIDKKREETGGVAVHITPRSHEQVVDIPLLDEQVQVQRVPINRPVDTPPSVRQEGDVTIVPVFEEVLVVEKRLILKEEIRITRRQTQRNERQKVTLQHEEVHVVRTPPPAATSTPAQKNSEFPDKSAT
jgi:uncharacterized protein (TIGR02271 family)